MKQSLKSSWEAQSRSHELSLYVSVLLLVAAAIVGTTCCVVSANFCIFNVIILTRTSKILFESSTSQSSRSTSWGKFKFDSEESSLLASIQLVIFLAKSARVLSDNKGFLPFYLSMSAWNLMSVVIPAILGNILRILVFCFIVKLKRHSILSVFIFSEPLLLRFLCKIFLRSKL